MCLVPTTLVQAANSFFLLSSLYFEIIERRRHRRQSGIVGVNWPLQLNTIKTQTSKVYPLFKRQYGIDMNRNHDK